MEEPNGSALKVFAVSCILAILAQRAHNTETEVGRLVQDIKQALIRNRLAAPTANHCGRADCTPHPDFRLTCPRDCSAAPFRAECRYPSEDCQAPDHCGRVDCTPHPDNGLTCPDDCSTAPWREDCRDPAAECLAQCQTDEIASPLKAGDRVTRGPGWRSEWENEDGGDGASGTVIHVGDDASEWVTVKWDATGKAHYYPKKAAGHRNVFEKLNGWCPRTVATACETTCHHAREDWNRPHNTGDTVVLTKTYHDGPSELVSTVSYAEGLPGRIIRTETRNGQCGVVIKFHGKNAQDNTFYPESHFLPRRWEYKNGCNCGCPQYIPNRVFLGRAQNAREDIRASGPDVVDTELFIPTVHHLDHLQRI